MDTSCQIEMPRYQCHKKVWALKIKEITNSSTGGYLNFDNDRYAPIEMNAEWISKHKPQSGGYFVVYGDGYKSYSPADAFESGYTKI